MTKQRKQEVHNDMGIHMSWRVGGGLRESLNRMLKNWTIINRTEVKRRDWKEFVFQAEG